MKKWAEVKEMGSFYIEKVLIQFDIPLLFVCQNRNRKYLVLCEDEEEGIYLCAKCNDSSLLKMLNQQISMDEIFRRNMKNLFLEYNCEEEIFHSKWIKTKDISEDMFPDKGAKFTLKNKKIQDYIQELDDSTDESTEEIKIEMPKKISYSGEEKSGDLLVWFVKINDRNKELPILAAPQKNLKDNNYLSNEKWEDIFLDDIGTKNNNYIENIEDIKYGKTEYSYCAEDGNYWKERVCF